MPAKLKVSNPYTSQQPSTSKPKGVADAKSAKKTSNSDEDLVVCPCPACGGAKVPTSIAYEHSVEDVLRKAEKLESLAIQRDYEIMVAELQSKQSKEYVTLSHTLTMLAASDQVSALSSDVCSASLSDTIFDTLNTFPSSKPNPRHRSNTRIERSKCTIGSSRYFVNADEYYNTPYGDKDRDPDPLLVLITYVIGISSFILGLSRVKCNFFLNMWSFSLQTAWLRHQKDPKLDPRNEALLSSIPKDTRTILNDFNVEGHYIIYATCKNCHSTYKPMYKVNSNIPIYQDRCTGRQYGGPLCNELLLKYCTIGKCKIGVPNRPWVVHDFKHWVANLVSRHESLMDVASQKAQRRLLEALGKHDIKTGTNTLVENWKLLENSIENPQELLNTLRPNLMEEVTDGDIVWEYRDKDGIPFLLHEGNEGRYLFSLSIDFANPYTMKESGISASIGIVSLACVHLPIQIRYKPENMLLLCIIPGPFEPTGTNLNHYITPIVREINDCYDPGVTIQPTPKHSEGRLCRCGVCMIVCDLVGARRAIGLPPATSEYFCSICGCSINREGYHSTDITGWKRRDVDAMRQAAFAHRDASTKEEADKLYAKNHVAWSPFWEWKTFDPTRTVVVDFMHNGCLGLEQTHYRDNLRMNTKSIKEGDPDYILTLLDVDAAPDHFTDTQCKDLEAIKRRLVKPFTENMSKGLMRKAKPSLQFACRELDIYPEMEKCSKSVLVDVLVAWHHINHARVSHPDSEEFRHFVTLEDMVEVWKDLRNTISPSWIDPVPTDFGNPRHGKLKAKQWQTAGVFHLPRTLIRIWGNLPENDLRLKQLDNMVDLVDAMKIAELRILTTDDDIPRYTRLMRSYVSQLRLLYPFRRLRPNHHMSLHLAEFMFRYGPVYGWWTAPFERLIGQVQRINHNGRVGGEMEKTMSIAYTKGANLRALLTRSNCPKVITATTTILESLLNSELFNDNVPESEPTGVIKSETSPASKPVPFPPHLRKPMAPFVGAAIPTYIYTHQYQAFKRSPSVKFSPVTVHQGNSQVYFLDTSKRTQYAAQIQCIFSPIECPQDLFVVIRRYKQLILPNDPYELFPSFLTGIYVTEPDLKEEIKHFKDIVGHFSLTPYSRGQVAITLHRSDF